MRVNNYYTEPTLYPKNASAKDLTKSWRVRFDFYQDGKRHCLSRKQAGPHNLNEIKSFTERKALANAMIKELKRRLKNGWNPITNTYPVKSPKQIELEELQKASFEDALQFAYDKKKTDWSYKTCQDYSSVKKYTVIACKNLGIDKKIKEFRKVDFKMILEEVTENRKLSNKGYNKYREYLSSLIGELVEWDVLESNVIRDIKTKDTQKTLAHRPPTQDQRLVIVDRIKTNHRNYFRFISILYGCTIRPKEITKIQIKHLHKLEGLFRLPATITKNKVERDVAIPNWVMDLLSELNLHTYDPEYYIFSGKGNLFMPGPNRMHCNTPTNYWKKIVKDKKSGLGMEVNQYSLKKLSGDDMVRLQRREGIHKILELPKRQMGHSDTSMTEVYVDYHNDILQELIREKMPEL
jgi:integrase